MSEVQRRSGTFDLPHFPLIDVKISRSELPVNPLICARLPMRFWTRHWHTRFGNPSWESLAMIGTLPIRFFQSQTSVK